MWRASQELSTQLSKLLYLEAQYKNDQTAQENPAAQLQRVQ